MLNRAILILDPDDSLVNLVQDYIAQQPKSVRVLGSQQVTAGNAHRGLRTRHLEQVKAHIEAHLSESVTLADLAALVGLSPGHFARLFKNSVGRSPFQYIIQRRVQKAKSLLTHSRLPVTDIAFEVGYEEVSNFIRAFRQQTGVTPRKYRSQG